MNLMDIFIESKPWITIAQDLLEVESPSLYISIEFVHRKHTV